MTGERDTLPYGKSNILPDEKAQQQDLIPDRNGKETVIWQCLSLSCTVPQVYWISPKAGLIRERREGRKKSACGTILSRRLSTILLLQRATAGQNGTTQSNSHHVTLLNNQCVICNRSGLQKASFWLDIFSNHRQTNAYFLIKLIFRLRFDLSNT